MKKTVIILLALSVIPGFLRGKTIPIPGLNIPDSITVDKEKFYVTEQASVYIYSLKTCKRLKQFGRKGQGPKEFAQSSGLYLSLQPDSLLIESQGKISFFSKDGEFIKEQRTPVGISSYRPLDKLYVGSNFDMNSKESSFRFALYDENQKKIKEFLILKTPIGFNAMYTGFDPVMSLTDPTLTCRYNRIFIMDPRKAIHVFDIEGNEMFLLRYGFAELKVTEELKEEVYTHFKDNVENVKPIFEQIKPLMKFPETFPPIRDFLIADHHIYMLPYARENDDIYLYTFDLEGKFLNKKPLPIKEQSIMKFYPYTIRDSTLYQLVENDDEEWELQITPFQP